MRRPPLLSLGLLLLAALAARTAPAADLRVATILVQGLDRVERSQLLDDLRLHEGDGYAPEFERELERRGRRLPYLSSFRVESRSGNLGVHLTLRVKESRRLNIAPFLNTLDDGELDGGLRLDAAALVGLGELWEGRVLVGSYAEGRLGVRDLGLLPGVSLAAEIGASDYDDPFLSADVSRRWGLVGPDLRLPGGGALGLRAGWERVDAEPAYGRDPDGSEAHVLSRLILRQPLLGEALELAVDAALRNPTDERGYARGVAALIARRGLGRWRLESRLAGGLASNDSPDTEIHRAAGWSILRAYEPGDFPAREFHAARVRADLTLFHLPIRLRRGAAPEPAALGPYFLLEAARFREYRARDFADATDWGLGVSMMLPARLPVRASLGLQWDEDGEAHSVFILEEH